MRRRQRFGDVEISDAKRLCALDDENNPLQTMGRSRPDVQGLKQLLEQK